MEPVSDEGKVSLPEGMVAMVDENGKPNEITIGVWKAIGYGFIVDVAEESLQFFNVTESWGWKQAMGEQLFFQPGKTKNQARITLHPLEPGYNVVRLEKLPEVCQREVDWTPDKVFAAFVDQFRTHYPFFKLRNVDWEQRAREIGETVSKESTDEELFVAMQAMLKDLDDGHVSLSAEIGGKPKRIRSERESTLTRLRKSYSKSEPFPTYTAYFRDWVARLKTGITEDSLHGQGKIAANEKIIWGRVHDKVGYIFISGMGGYSFGDTDHQVAALHSALNEILEELKDTDAMIIDVSFNGGGSDLFSLEIASHFADKRRLGFSKWPAIAKQYRQDRFVTPIQESDETSVSYHKPIFLVTNDVTASAAEIFTMCMKAMPHVTSIGQPTEGALSDILPKTLPNGWELGLSNEIYVDHEEVCHEGPGIAPDIEIPIFSDSDIASIGHAEAIEKIKNLILEKLK